MKKIINAQRYHALKAVLTLTYLTLLSVTFLVACADDDLVSHVDNGTVVAFSVEDFQNSAGANATPAGGTITRAAFFEGLALHNLSPEDLSTQQIDVEGTAEGVNELCLVETTIAGVNPTAQHDAKTRANISTAITENFSSIGYRGTTAESISTKPWFHNKETKTDGTLLQPTLWSWGERFGRFYGISPQVKPGDSKLTVSPESYAGTPYLDFEVETGVSKQRDLMTACSDVVEYATQNVAPPIFLSFRHALTAIRFKVGKNLMRDKHITKVEIVGAMSKGRYTLATDKDGSGAVWSNQENPKTFTLDGVSVSTSKDVNQILMGNEGDNFTFFMLPQHLTGKNVQIKIYFDGSADAAITAPLKGEWKAGTTKTYSLSQKTVDWTYVFEVTSPYAVAFNKTETNNYTVRSYRYDSKTYDVQDMRWKVVGYDQNDDGKFSMDEKPEWLISLSKTEGEGGISAESGIATLKTDYIEELAPRNKSLKSAKEVGSIDNPYDLSTKGGSTARSTANSYVISAAGHYCIPLVYGNAITEGKNNRSSYQTSNEGARILKHFKDHALKDITDPWITRSNGGKNVPDNVKLVWEDESGLVTNLSLSGSDNNAFVNFEVPASAIKNGNAVIAVTKGGVVVWSWHLWFTVQEVLNTVEFINATGYHYKFIREPLGYKYTDWTVSTYSSPRSVRVKVEQINANSAEKQYGVFVITQKNGKYRRGYSTLYQFGRKEALPGTDDIKQKFRYPYDRPSRDCTIDYAIQHPEYILPSSIDGENYGNWCNYNYLNLWSADNTVEGYNDNPVIKTIYDPCPAGFKMPASKAFTGFTPNGKRIDDAKEANGTYADGWDFKSNIAGTDATVYFPVMGYRGLNNGQLNAKTHTGMFWTATPYGSRYAVFMDIDWGKVAPQSYNARGLGCSVHPVEE